MQRMCLADSRRAVKQQPLLGRQSQLREPRTLPHELDDVAVEQLESLPGQNYLIPLDCSQLVDLDASRRPREPVRLLLQRQDLSPIGPGLLDRALQMPEELLRDLRADLVVWRRDL